MNNVKMMGSLLDRLLSYVSSAPERDANYDIAVALLRNYSQLKGLALSQIADLCYTSNASISRFCRFLGMDNFKEFQSWMERDLPCGPTIPASSILCSTTTKKLPSAPTGTL